MKWQYKTVSLTDATLDDMGEDGWELIWIVDKAGIFKRPKEETTLRDIEVRLMRIFDNMPTRDPNGAAHVSPMKEQPKEEKPECGCSPLEPVMTRKTFCKQHTLNVQTSYGTSGTSKEQPCTCPGVIGGLSTSACPKHDA